DEKQRFEFEHDFRLSKAHFAQESASKLLTRTAWLRIQSRSFKSFEPQFRGEVRRCDRKIVFDFKLDFSQVDPLWLKREREGLSPLTSGVACFSKDFDSLSC
ncbi:MAG TPA: hypothetical protein VHM25_18545, partial [Polyangiaceae bacterium]|nr:hypothetical protein [Polyangiaceae bacterium]